MIAREQRWYAGCFSCSSHARGASLACVVAMVCAPCIGFAQDNTAQQPPADTTAQPVDAGVPADPVVQDLATQLGLVRDQNANLREQIRLLQAERNAILAQLRFVQQILVEHDLVDEALLRASGGQSSQPADRAQPNLRDAPNQNTRKEHATNTSNDEPVTEFRASAWADAEPFSSPWALRAAIVRSYSTELGSINRATSHEEDLFHDAVARWTRKASRELRSQVLWTVSLDRVERDERGSRRYSGFLRVVDPTTGLGIGTSVRVPVPERFAVRVVRSPDVSYWELRAEVIAAPRYNPDRADRGIFDEPPIIGPFAEHGWKLVWRNLQPWKAAEPEPR